MEQYRNGYGLKKNVWDYYLNKIYDYEMYEYTKNNIYLSSHNHITKLIDNINLIKNKSLKNMLLGWRTSYLNFPRLFDFSGLQISITDSCQLQCLHCYNKNIPRNNIMLSLNDIKEYYNKVMELSKILPSYPIKKGKITITGGEPLLNHDLYDIVKFFTDNQYQVMILSNGLIYNKDISNILSKTDSILQISIDGMEEIHDYIRGKGTFCKTIDNIKKYINDNVKIYISFTSNLLNYKEYPKVYSFLRNIGASVIWQDRYVTDCNSKLLPLDKKATIEWNRYNISLSSTNNDKCRTGLHRTLQNTRTKPCTAGTFPVLDVHGNIKACGRLNIIVSNIKKDTSIIAQEMMKFLIGYRMCPIDCIDCKKLEKCMGGSCCVSYAESNMAHIRDKGCEYINFKK